MKITIETGSDKVDIVYENVSEFLMIGTHAPEPGKVRTPFNRFKGDKFELIGKAEEMKERLKDCDGTG